MGTQRSSKGPKGGVPLIPPWVQQVEVSPEKPPEEAQPDKKPKKEGAETSPPSTPMLAPARRFFGTSINLSKFADTGSQSSLAKGLGNYVRSGLGGASSGAHRMSGTASVAGRLYGGLEGFRTGDAQPQELGLDKASLSGRPAREVGDKIIDAVCPIDGSQDTEARRDSLSRSISELAEQYEDLDLTALTPEQIDRLLEMFVGNDISQRIELDVGKAILDKAANYAAAVKRMEEMRQYVREKVSATFRGLLKLGEKLNRKTSQNLMAKVIRDTLKVFEDYL